MDPVTHSAAGLLGGQAVRHWFGGRAILLFTLIAALIPDIDNFVGRGNPELYLIHHRGITHSLLGGLALALALALAFRALFRRRPLWLLFVIAFGGIVGHIFLDLITAYGTQVFFPMNNERYTIECVFIIDPLFTITMIVFLVASFISGKHRRLIAVLGIAWTLAYPFANLMVRGAVTDRLESRLTREGIGYEKVHVTPEFLTPFVWKAIVEDGPTYRLAQVRLFDPGRPLVFEDFRKADRGVMEALGGKATFFKTYSWFSRYPVVKETSASEGKRITFGDLRFHSTQTTWRNLFRNGGMPFSLTAVLDENGNLTSYEYSPPRREVFIQRVE